jgi:hypothetical protein
VGHQDGRDKVGDGMRKRNARYHQGGGTCCFGSLLNVTTESEKGSKGGGGDASWSLRTWGEVLRGFSKLKS